MFGFGKKKVKTVPEVIKEKRYRVIAILILLKGGDKRIPISDKKWEKEEDAIVELEAFLKKVEYSLNATDNYVTIMGSVFDKRELHYVDSYIKEIEI